MKRFVMFVVVAIAAVSYATPAIAQSRVSNETPAAEVALYGGLWNLMPSGPIGLGGRLTVNRTDWLGTEVSVEARKQDQYGPGDAMVLVNMRALATDPNAAKSAFVTAGGAFGVGLRRTLAPMIGFGGQTLWTGGLIAARGELQYFPGGLIYEHSNARVLVSVAIALR